ncbi:phage recombination protein Bet [Salinisphaera hydrothermalis]|uniref:Recombination protein BET n=1 Tax=Salinisphaera hydrothermalis (strain C41B8) TaxID=1304275 RepID=A0A084INR8_SALHC|nr:Recombination protein BET [Salinisphaera hydrothermalis C41B8]
MTNGASNQGRSGGQKKLIERIGDKYGVDANKMLSTLTATAFRQKNDQPITNEQMMALLVVADQYNLNPFTKEIYAFPDKNAGIVPIVGVDGWSRIINEHDSFDGMDFEASDEFIELDKHHKKCPEYITCRMYRKDRSRPVEITEYLDEVYRPPFMKNGNPMIGPWQSHTKRFLRHKAMIQCARLAFGFVGIFDQDEAERIVQGEVVSSERNGAAPPARQTEAPAAAERTLNDQQQNQVQAAIEESGADKAGLLKQLGVASIDQIPVTRFSLVMDRINAQTEDA